VVSPIVDFYPICVDDDNGMTSSYNNNVPPTVVLDISEQAVSSFNNVHKLSHSPDTQS
jgi:hypothetical protein